MRNLRRIASLLLFAAIAFLIEGYHPYAEDAEIYLPGVLKILHPGLYARNADFFGEHAGHTLLSEPDRWFGAGYSFVVALRSSPAAIRLDPADAGRNPAPGGGFL